MTSLAGTVIVALLAAQLPERVYSDRLDGHLLWTSAEYVLTADGRVRDLAGEATATVASLRKQLDLAAEKHGPEYDHGLTDGTIPPAELCTGPTRPSAVKDYAGPETNDFNLTVLLSEVIVEGTVSSYTLGFSGSGTPVAMLTLENVKPLRQGSPIPTAVLVSIPRLVVRGEVFCGFVVGSRTTRVYKPKTGSRVLVVGAWNSSGIVPLLPGATTGAFAEIQGDQVHWSYLTAHNPPETYGAFTRALEAMRLAGLLSWSQQDARKGYGERFEFSQMWRSYEQRGCRLVRTTIIDGEWDLEEQCEVPEI